MKMKVCVTATGKDLNALVDARFGRCQVFVFIDTDTMDYDVVENQAMMSGGGAGTKAAQTVADSGVTAVLTGNVGPNAFRALDAAGIKVYTGAGGTVKDAVDMFNKGDLEAASGASVKQHAGMNPGR
jgi:predicted Fe-Mo cluster-binding NifX family protein